jgi:hypothetical protein
MTRATWVFAMTSLVGAVLAIYLYLDNRDLEDKLTELRATEHAAAPSGEKVAAAQATDTWTEPQPATGSSRGVGTGPAPKLPEEKKESRLDRRARRQQEFASMFGRIDGETEDEYKNRIVPMIKAGLLIPRQRVDEMRRQAEEKAGVTADQSKKLDQAFEQVYADAIDYTNKAVQDGMLSPYERNVSGWLEYAGGLGGILNDANGQIGKILSSTQLRTMSQSGFEWGEYLGLNAPWELLRPPPPPR